MAAIVVHAPADPLVAGRVTLYDPSANTPDYNAETNKLVNPDLSAVAGVPSAHWKVVSGAVAEMSPTEKELVTVPPTFSVDVGDALVVEDVGGSPGLPVVGGSQLTDVKASYNQLVSVKKYSDKTTYKYVSRFDFPGTDVLKGIPDKAVAVLSMDGGAGSARLYDVTNANVIAEVTGITTTTPTATEMGSLANLPTGPAVFEFQLKVTDTDDDAGSEILADSLHIYKV